MVVADASIRTTQTNGPQDAAPYGVLRNVSKIFGPAQGGLRAIDNISHTVRTGTLVSFLGPSGCGKPPCCASLPA